MKYAIDLEFPAIAAGQFADKSNPEGHAERPKAPA